MKSIPLKQVLLDSWFYLKVREQLKDSSKEYDKSENDLKALQSVGQVKYA